MSEEEGLTNMSRICVVAASAIITVAITGVTRYRQAAAPNDNDEDAYYQTAIIKGVVTILNHPTLGNTPGSSTFLVFQRVDCKRSIVGTWTDMNGHYQIHVGPGRYKLIVRGGKREKETRDVLAPNQQRFIDAGQPGTITDFNIDIIVPKD
jgi:hypothetical protein